MKLKLYIIMIILCIQLIYADTYETGTSFTPTLSNITYNLTQNISVTSIHVGTTCFNVTSTNVWDGDYCYTSTTPLIVYMDNETPTMTIMAPANNSLVVEDNVSFSFNASDYFPQQAILYGNFSGSYAQNQTIDWVRLINNTFLGINLSYNTYIWDVYLNDSGGNYLYSDNYTLYVNKISNITTTTSTTSVEINYNTDIATYTNIFYGTTSGSLSTNASNSTVTSFHHINITGLDTNTVYYYIIEVCFGSICSNSSEHRFTTSAPESTGSGFPKTPKDSEYVSGLGYPLDGHLEITIKNGIICENKRSQILLSAVDSDGSDIKLDKAYFIADSINYTMFSLADGFIFIGTITNNTDHITFYGLTNINGLPYYLTNTTFVDVGECTGKWLVIKEVTMDINNPLSNLKNWSSLTDDEKFKLCSTILIFIGLLFLIIYTMKGQYEQ